MDEKMMLMEQDRQAKEKKRKKNRKKLGIVAIIMLVIILGIIWYLVWGRHMNAAEESTVQISVGAKQEVVYAGLIEVNGNEITYQVAQERSGEESDSSQRGGMFRNGEVSESGERPQWGGTSEAGERPQWSGMSQEGETSQWGGGRGQFMMNTQEAEGFAYDGVTYELTGETVTTMIPVGTDVTTKLGTVTTFSRLAAGDNVALVMEEDEGEQIIVAVYIIE